MDGLRRLSRGFLLHPAFRPRLCEIDHAVFEDLIHRRYYFLIVFEQLGM